MSGAPIDGAPVHADPDSGAAGIGAPGSRGGRGLLLVAAFALAVGLVSIAGKEIGGNDDPRVAGIARGMALSGDYALPRLNGRPFLEYPPLGYVPAAISLRIAGGHSDFLAFLPSVILGTGTALLAAGIGSLLAGIRVGTLTGLMLASMSGYVSVHSSCLADPSLLFWVTLSLWGFVAGRAALRDAGGPTPPRAPPRSSFPRFSLFYFGSAAALLSKGLIGLAVPLAVVGADICIERDLSTLRRMRIHAGILVFALPIAAWAAVVGALHGRGPLLEVARQSLWRGFSESTDHSQPAWYYFTGPILVVLLPWTLVPLLSAWARWGPPRRAERLLPGREGLFPAVWLCVTLAGLSVASAKRYLYLGPLLPAGAILAAMTWDRSARFVPLALRLERWFAPVFLVALGAFQVLQAIPEAHRESLRPAFEAVARERQGGGIILVTPRDPERDSSRPSIVKESFSGAAVFYLGEVVPETTDPADVTARLAADTSRRWIVASYHKLRLAPLGAGSPPPGLVKVYEGTVGDRSGVVVFVRPGATP